MQENNMQPIPPLEPCPSDLDLAAFLDGDLATARAEEIRQHILRCADCSELYGDAHLFEIERVAPPVANVIPFEPKTKNQPPAAPPAVPLSRRTGATPVRWLSMAASLVMAALTAYFFWPELPKAPLPMQALAPEETGLTPAFAQKVGAAVVNNSTVRAAARESIGGATAQVKIGAGICDLEIALLRKDRAATTAVGRQLVAALKALSSRDRETESLQALFLEVQDANDATAPLSEAELLKVRAATRRLRELSIDREGPLQDLGLWAGGGYWAAEVGYAQFFNAKRTQEFLAWLQQDQEAREPRIKLKPEGQKALAVIAQSWRQAASKDSPNGELGRAFATLRAGTAIADESP